MSETNNSRNREFDSSTSNFLKVVPMVFVAFKIRSREIE